MKSLAKVIKPPAVFKALTGNGESRAKSTSGFFATNSGLVVNTGYFFSSGNVTITETFTSSVTTG